MLYSLKNKYLNILLNRLIYLLCIKFLHNKIVNLIKQLNYQ